MHLHPSLNPISLQGFYSVSFYLKSENQILNKFIMIDLSLKEAGLINGLAFADPAPIIDLEELWNGGSPGPFDPTIPRQI